MLSVLGNRIYRRLFLAQVVALLGTGLATIALGLLAYDLAGAEAGAVLGVALAVKMIAYVGVSPLLTAATEKLPRRRVLIALDLIRAGVALALPFVDQIWQIYVLIFVLQSASAGFTPTFQATIPDVLPDEEDYTHALSISRLAYDLESLISPMLAAALLTVVSFQALFAGTVIGFLASASLVLSVTLPSPRPTEKRPFWRRVTHGARLYLATPRLRGLLALNAAVSAAGAMVIVNTVVLVQDRFGLGQSEVALALAAFGGGSMAAALALPRVLAHVPDRATMLTGAGALAIGMTLGPLVQDLPALAALWLVVGVGYSLVQTPSGRLLRRSAHPEDRPALFAAQFALSHACWLVGYPLAGWLGVAAGMQTLFLVMAAICVLSIIAAIRLWPARDPEDLPHRHDALPADHPHLKAHPTDAHGRHIHAFVIDTLHERWPNHS